MNPSSSETTGTNGRRRGRRRRRLFLYLLVTPLMVGLLAVFLLTRSFVLVAMIEPALSDSIGGEVHIGSVRIAGRRHVVLHDVILRARDIPGDGGEVFRAARVQVNADILDLVRGDVDLLEVVLSEAVFRVSEERNDPGNFAFAALGDDDDSDDESPSPRLVLHVTDGVIEVGTHEADRFDVGGRLPIAGTLANLSEDQDWFNFDFSETADDGRPLADAGIRVRGRINTETFANEGRVDGVAFTTRIRGLCPQIVQLWWDRLDLDGEVSHAGIQFDGERDLWIEIAVKDVGLTIPISEQGVWARYADGVIVEGAGMPRMRVDSGRIQLRNERIELHNLRGELTSSSDDPLIAGVPYRVNGTIGPLAEIDWNDRDAWMQSAIEATPLDLTFYLEGFRLYSTSDGPNSVVELPAVVIDVLEKFRIRACTLNSNIEIERALPIIDSDGALRPSELRTYGTAQLSEGTGAFEKFPYPLQNVSAHVDFSNERIVVQTLLGEGPRGGRVSVAGVIQPPGKWPEVSLHLSATDVPLDDLMRDAMPEKYQGVLDALMHEDSLAELREAGAIPDEEALDKGRDELAMLHKALADQTGDERPDEALRRRIDSLQRMVDAGHFVMGGRADLELDIRRALGRYQPTKTTGRIDVRRAGLVFDRFPYPVTFASGRLELHEDEVVLHDWRGVALGGGQVLINGAIDLSGDGDTGRRMRPEIEVGVVDDLANLALVKAIPMAGRTGSAADSPTPLDAAGNLLSAAGIEGLVSAQGRVTVDEQERTDWDFAIRIESGRARPAARIDEAVEEMGFTWPASFTIDDLEGVVRVTRDQINLASITGRRATGAMEVSGTVDLADSGPAAEIDVAFDSLPVDDYLLDFLGEADRAVAQELWGRYQPRGIVDAELRYRAREGVIEPLVLEVTPRNVTLGVDDHDATLTPGASAATITIGDEIITFSNVGFALQTAGVADGEVTFEGTVTRSHQDRESALSVNWTGGRFESPWVREALEFAEANRMLEYFETYSPRGRFTIGLVLRSGPAGPADYVLHVEPATVLVDIDGAEVGAAMASGSVLDVRPGEVLLDGFGGEFIEGGYFELTGSIMTAPLVEAQLMISYAGPFHESVRAILPEGILASLDAVDLSISDSIAINRAALDLIQLSEEGASDAWRRSFKGLAEVSGLAFTAGLEFRNVAGTIDIDVGKNGSAPVNLRLNADVADGIVRDWRLEDAQALVVLSPDGQSVLMPHFRGTMHGGTISAEAAVRLEERGIYRVAVDAVGLNLRALTAEVVDDESAQPAADPDSRSEGLLYGAFALEGRRGIIDSRRGRGTIRVMHGRLAENPITLPLIQILQLMPPLSASLNYAQLDFFIEDEIAVLEPVVLEGDQLLLDGVGSMNTTDFSLDLYLRPRGKVVGLSELVGRLNDQLYAIHVTGTLGRPEANLVPVPGLGGFYRRDWTAQGVRRVSTMTPESDSADND